MQPFTCIYCKESRPAVAASEAHVFPHALGGSQRTTDTVCGACNQLVNREVENPALPIFRVFRSMHGVRGRRGVPGVPATAIIEGYRAPVNLGELGRPREAVVRIETDERGNKRYVVYGTDEMIRTKFEEISRKHPELVWNEGREDVTVEIVAEGPLDLTGAAFRRLAAKIAFERFAQLRGSAVATGNDFDSIRHFILTGAQNSPCCGVCADSRLLNGSLNIPVPCHAVALVAHPADRVLGGFVIFFGLFLYWAILSSRYTALGPLDDLLIERPHTRESYSPLLRSGVGALRVPWHEIITPFLEDPAAVARAAMKHATTKFRGAADAFYDDRSNPPE